MKLSKLIRYINTVNQLSLSTLGGAATTAVNRVVADISQGNENINVSSYVDELSTIHESILQSVSSFNTVLDNLREQLLLERQELEHQAFEKSYQIYDMQQADPNIAKNVMDLHLYKTWIYHDRDIKYYKDRISLYGSWQHAGMLIRPLRGTIIDAMLQCDPLYIVDEAPALLSPTKKLFTPQYQRRLRYKVIKEKQPAPYLLDLIPNNQLGFIVVNEYFNKRPLELIKTYLEEFLVLLKPGGVVLFTFNDCDNPIAVANFESGLYSYVPGGLLKRIVEGLGYEILNSHASDRSIHWLEIKKPGELTSIRGGQTLGVIKKHQLPK